MTRRVYTPNTSTRRYRAKHCRLPMTLDFKHLLRCTYFVCMWVCLSVTCVHYVTRWHSLPLNWTQAGL